MRWKTDGGYIAAEQNKGKKMERYEDILRDPWDNIKGNNILITWGLRRRRERERAQENI